MKKVRVIYAGWGERWHLGTLADNGQQLLFEYSPEALRQGLELSPRHLKLRAEAYGGFPDFLMRLPGFVADSLPDGWGLALMDRLFRRQGIEPRTLSPLDRLSFIGHRALGALLFEPETGDALDPEVVLLQTLAEESQLALADVDTQALRQLALMGGSPHGARPKVLVHWDSISGLLGTTPTAKSLPWLVKFQAQGEHKEVCAIEALYAVLARECGLDMPQTYHFDLGPHLAGFGIQRFDVEAGQRVPVLTLAGLLHANFQQPQVDALTFLRATRFLTQDMREVRKAFGRVVFNVLFHNRDDHTKNFSYLLSRERRWLLAPCYDLSFNEGRGGEHAMDVGGHGRDITRSHLLTLARQADLAESQATAAIDYMRDAASRFEKLASDAPIRRATLSHIRQRMQASSALLR